jgi:hypothetical protein
MAPWMERMHPSSAAITLGDRFSSHGDAKRPQPPSVPGAIRATMRIRMRMTLSLTLFA